MTNTREGQQPTHNFHHLILCILSHHLHTIHEGWGKGPIFFINNLFSSVPKETLSLLSLPSPLVYHSFSAYHSALIVSLLHPHIFFKQERHHARQTDIQLLGITLHLCTRYPRLPLSVAFAVCQCFLFFGSPFQRDVCFG